MSEAKGISQAAQSSLERMAEEFARAGAAFPSLYHDMVFGVPVGPALTMPDYQLDAFMSAHPAGGSELFEWHGPHPYKFKGHSMGERRVPSSQHPFETELFWCGHFRGNADGLERFKTLAGSLYAILNQFSSNLPEKDWWGILMLFHIIAVREPSPFIRVERRVWGWDNDLDEQVTWEAVSEASTTRSDDPIYNALSIEGVDQSFVNKGARLVTRREWCEAKDETGRVLHPIVWSLKNDVFAVAREAIRKILEPGSVVAVEEDQSQHTPFKLILPVTFSNELEINAPSPFTDRQRKSSFVPADDTAPSKAEKPFVFEYLPDFDRWHVRFRYGPDDDDVLDVKLRPEKGLLHIALMLERPDEAVRCTVISPLSRQPKGRSIVEQLGVDSSPEATSSHAWSQESDPEFKEAQKEMRELAAEIEKKRRLQDFAKVETLKKILQSDVEEIQKKFDKFGRRREAGRPSADNAAAKRVNTYKKRAIEKIRASSKSRTANAKGLIALANHLEAIKVEGNECFYRPPRNLPYLKDIRWVVTLPPVSR